jgi:Spy/CpxP family protein refolding chaperone
MTFKEDLPMLRKTLFAAAALAALLLPAVAEAAQRPDPRALLHNPRALARYLRLTAAQIEQQKVLVQELRAEVKPLRESLAPLQEDLAEALAAASPDACAVGALVVDVDEVRDDIRAAYEDYDEAFSAILTPEQLARYEALKELAEGYGEG